MTTREDEPEAVVGNVAHVGLVSLEFLKLGQASDRLGLLLQLAVSPQAIYGAVTGRCCYPGGRIIGNAPNGPSAEGIEERLLDGLLGEIEIPEDANEGRDRPSLLLAEQAVDDPSCVGTYDGWSSNFWIGRTSTAPRLTLGILEAASIASSRFGQST